MSKSRNGRMPLARIFEDFRRGPMTVLVWLLAVGGVAFLLTHRAGRFEYLGLARAVEHTVSPEMSGRIGAVLVDVCEDVRTGQIVVVLDSALLNARIETARAGVEEIRAQLDAARAEAAESEASEAGRRQARLADLKVREEQYRADALELKVKIESDRVEERRLRIESERARRLFESRAGSQEDYEILRLRHEEIVRRIDENTTLLARLEKDLGAAQARTGEFLKSLSQPVSSDERLAPLRKAIRKQELVLEELKITREKTYLLAPVDGRVTRILCHAGQAVGTAEPVLQICESCVSHVVGYVSEVNAVDGAIRRNGIVEVAPADRPQVVSEGRIVGMGSAIEALPSRLQRSDRRTEFGRAFLVSAPAGLDLMPNERVVIRARY